MGFCLMVVVVVIQNSVLCVVIHILKSTQYRVSHFLDVFTVIISLTIICDDGSDTDECADLFMEPGCDELQEECVWIACNYFGIILMMIIVRFNEIGF